ncbi:MAG: HlyD family type I secretion periplasmic adaptor subunit [Paracoccaceae bacterium]|nr:HlyD family type I secretion periplasmic adaptor subunit [Paracoccaceae bacterium]
MTGQADPYGDTPLRTALRWPAVLGVIASLIMVGAGVGWAQWTKINGAVIASGSVVVRGKPKSVQHLDGGIVEEILVQDGDRVRRGDPLVRLDAVLLSANLDIYRTRLAEALARHARLDAERSGAETVEFGAASDLLQGQALDASQRGQVEIFSSRREVQKGRYEQLAEKVRQYGNQANGTSALKAAKEDQLDLIGQELKTMQDLADKGLTRESQVLAIQRSRADLLGQVAEHESELARIVNSIRDTELEMLLLDMQFKEEAVTELREVRTQIEELTQQIISTEKQLERVDVRAPVDGTVHEMQVVTVGGVVAPGAVILQVIPTGDGLQFETQVNPAAIDQVYIGQNATLRLTAFNQRTTPELKGTVSGISPNTVTDPTTGMVFYRALLSVSPEEIARLDGLEIVPGMPVEAFMQTGERSVLSYLTRPLQDQLDRAFREE